VSLLVGGVTAASARRALQPSAFLRFEADSTYADRFRERLNAKLANETMAQLKATEMLYEWLDAWEARNEVPSPSPEPDSTVVEPSFASILRTGWSDAMPTSSVPVSRRGLA
jgi:hypothetical protein